MYANGRNAQNTMKLAGGLAEAGLSNLNFGCFRGTVSIHGIQEETIPDPVPPPEAGSSETHAEWRLHWLLLGLIVSVALIKHAELVEQKKQARRIDTLFQEDSWDELWYRDNAPEKSHSTLSAVELDALCEQLVQGGAHAK